MRRREILAGPLALGSLSAAEPPRPRLFVNRARLDRLKRKISGSHSELWKMVRENAGSLAGRMPPSKYDSESEMRTAGRGIPWQALVWLVAGEPAFRDGAKRWMLRICEYPRWENNDSLAAGECLFGVAIGYDWLHDQMDQGERRLVRDKLVLQAEAMLNAPPVHHDRWLANHNHVEHLGLAAAGFALRGEAPRAEAWIRQAHAVFRKALEFSGPDGGSTEGHQYWAYSTESILRYAELARDLLKEDLYGSQWLKSVPDFIIHSTLPDFTADNCVMSYGDSHRSYDSHGPAHILYRTAAEYRNSQAQWLAQEMVRRGAGRKAYCGWASLLWYDETLEPVPLSRQPVFSHSEDVGWVTGRGAWEPGAVMTGFRCGPMHGHKAQKYYQGQAAGAREIGGGHGHPDVNSFQVYAYGKWLAIDPGYERPKWTRNHNTILVNGKGQLGEGQTWFDRKAVLGARATSAILKAEHRAGYDYTVGDAMNMYPPAAGLTRFRRHFIFVRPDFIVIVDELAAQGPSRFEWRMHAEQSLEQRGGAKFVVRNGETAMDVEFLLPEELGAKASGSLLTATVGPVANCLIVAVLHPRKADTPTAVAKLESIQQGRLGIAIGGRTKLVLDLAGQSVTLV
ncbi:MAG: heparinase II/III family protein [Acidobacteria bacterium]|nr:heparinase II/III family protein [Acidobacteriota bacterium]